MGRGRRKSTGKAAAAEAAAVRTPRRSSRGADGGEAKPRAASTAKARKRAATPKTPKRQEAGNVSDDNGVEKSAKRSRKSTSKSASRRKSGAATAAPPAPPLDVAGMRVVLLPGVGGEDGDVGTVLAKRDSEDPCKVLVVRPASLDADAVVRALVDRAAAGSAAASAGAGGGAGGGAPGDTAGSSGGAWRDTQHGVRTVDGASVHYSVITFADGRSARRAVASRSKVGAGDDDSLRGPKKWVAEYRAARPDMKVLQDEVDSYMAAFDEKETSAHEAAKVAKSTVDDDGFTLVTRKRRQKDVESEDAAAKRRKRKTEKELANFYRFQLRESRRDELAQMRIKFEEDRERVKRLKESRSFNPYA